MLSFIDMILNQIAQEADPFHRMEVSSSKVLEKLCSGVARVPMEQRERLIKEFIAADEEATLATEFPEGPMGQEAWEKLWGSIAQQIGYSVLIFWLSTNNQTESSEDCGDCIFCLIRKKKESIQKEREPSEKTECPNGVGQA